MHLKGLLLVCALAGIAFFQHATSNSVLASSLATSDEATDLLSLEADDDTVEQVTSVAQLADVYPSDWAFQAVQSLVERYGCLEGYPDQRFRGNRAISRYEFAAGLNACLARVNEILAKSSESLARKQDLEDIQQMQRIFQAELLALKYRIPSLEARTGRLEAQQFSTTTKLFGQVVVGVQGRTSNRADFFPVDGIQDLEDPGTEINVITNTQLTLLTQFNARSQLLTGLRAGTGSTAPRLTSDVRLGYEGDTDGRLELSDLTYRQAIGDRLAVIVGPVGVSPVNVFRGTNRVESTGFGPLSVFAQRNPILNLGAGRGGVGFDWQIARRVAFQGVYATTFPELPDLGGLFGGDAGGVTWGTQLNVGLATSFDIALNYLHAYTPKEAFSGSLGTGVGDDQVTVNSSLITNAFGTTMNWRISPQFVVGGWAGFTTSRIPDRSGTVETLNWMGFLNFPDLFGAGNLGAIFVGQPPRIISSNLPTGKNIPELLAGGTGEPGGQPGTTIHAEAFFRWRLRDRLVLTPGIIVIFNPGQTASSDTIVIGALRTTYSF